MSKTTLRLTTFSLPVTLSAEEKRHKELQEKYREMKKKMAERKAAVDKGDKKLGKRTMEEGEEATNELIKKVQEGKITMKKVDDKHTFKRSRLSSTTEGGRPLTLGEDGEILDPFDDDLESSPSTMWQEKRPEPHNRTIYIKGFDLQQDILRETFEKYGNIRRINIGERSRHGFIEFNHGAEAQTAIREMDGNMLGGTMIHVSFARRRSDHEGGKSQKPVFDDFTASNIV